MVSYNTFQLIQNANSVITINSSVGLEALILEKNVKFLSKTFFDKLTNEFLVNYIINYLIDIDFFSLKMCQHN